MVALAEDGGDRASLEISGTGVERCLETAAGTLGKRLLAERFGRTDHAGDETRVASITAIAATSPPLST